MITIWYIYKSKLSGNWIHSSRTFKDKRMALRFLYKMNPIAVIEGWSCDDQYDNEWLNQRFHVKGGQNV